jgi:hypothetical protein
MKNWPFCGSKMGRHLRTKRLMRNIDNAYGWSFCGHFLSKKTPERGQPTIAFIRISGCRNGAYFDDNFCVNFTLCCKFTQITAP